MLFRSGRLFGIEHDCKKAGLTADQVLVERLQRSKPIINNFSKMLARFRASSPDRCPQAAKSPCHPFGTRRGRQLFEAGRTRPPRLVARKQSTNILQLFQWNSCNGRSIVSCETLLLGKPIVCGSAKSLRSLPLCCSPVVALFELAMNFS